MFAAPSSPAAEAAAPAAERVFTLKEASAFEMGGREFTMGQTAETQDKPFSQVKAFPKFLSAKPIYGVIRFEADFRKPDSGTAYYFALDESRGTGKGFDRLYFDLDQDLDLKNEVAIHPLDQPPSGALMTYGGIKEQVAFDYLKLQLDTGGAGKPVEVMPRLVRTTYENETYDRFSFVRTRVYTGTIKVGSHELGARLGNQYLVTSRFNHPATALVLTPPDGSRVYYWWGGDSLSAAHKFDGKFYTFEASPVGDRLTVRPYTGELGTFEVGPGNRAVDHLSFSGSFRGENLSVPAGGEVKMGQPEAASTCQVPVGDYLPAALRIEFGKLRIFISDNYHSEGTTRGRAGRAPVYGIQIRKDKPFILDFSAKPQVLFASPAKDHRVKLGDTLEVKAVLVDPDLDVMIRGLDDSTRQKDGRYLSLDPTVVVKRSNGEKVAEGVMPFG